MHSALYAAASGGEEVGEVLFRVLGADLHGFRVVREFGVGQWRMRRGRDEWDNGATIAASRLRQIAQSLSISACSIAADDMRVGNTGMAKFSEQGYHVEM